MKQRIVAVVTVEQAADGAAIARALADGGVCAIELAWRTPATLAALAAMRSQAPETLVGLGTILTPLQVYAAVSGGAQFGVSPGLSVAVLAAARRVGLPFAPGVQTPTDVQTAIEQGCRRLKFFPAETSGGLAHLRAMNAPFAHLGVRYLALGGLSENHLPDYLREPCVDAIGGSWLVPAEAVRQRNWESIRQRAADACALIARAEKEAA